MGGCCGWPRIIIIEKKIRYIIALAGPGKAFEGKGQATRLTSLTSPISLPDLVGLPYKPYKAHQTIAFPLVFLWFS